MWYTNDNWKNGDINQANFKICKFVNLLGLFTFNHIINILAGYDSIDNSYNGKCWVFWRLFYQKIPLIRVAYLNEEYILKSNVWG